MLKRLATHRVALSAARPARLIHSARASSSLLRAQPRLQTHHRLYATQVQSIDTEPRHTYGTLTHADVAHFRSILAPSGVLSTIPDPDPKNKSQTQSVDDLAPFNTDWLNKYTGSSRCVLKPRTTEEVSAIVRYCYEKRLPVVPQGGNTGLVGGAVPIRDEVIINLGGMSAIRSFDPVSGVLVCDAGCILENLSTNLSQQGHIMPLDLGAKGSCQIGGNVSTNAGGLRLLRYGSLHGSVLGLEVVLPDGAVMSELSGLRKDNTGYDLKQLFIGAEGTLGLITGVSILCPTAPAASQALLIALPAFENVVELFKVTKSHLSEILSAFEYWDRESYNLVCHHTGRKALADNEVGDANAFVLIETSGGRKEHDEAKLEGLLEALYSDETNLINSGILSQSQDQFASLWGFRELIPEAASKEGRVYKYDVSVPVERFKEVTDKIRERLKGAGLLKEGGGGKVTDVLGYGHFGDGNIHLNVIADDYSDDVEDALEPFVYELVSSYNGSISAEHGIGQMKAHALHYSKSAVSRSYMKRIKDVFDERGIMNPGKVLH